ncbi:hypothetical protein AWP49_15695 [Escherichia coli]|nr:hypothetical protein AWP49_15695 [Escherichia coli]OKV39571.1 hypothetical protein AWP56_09310 [Escherichia coli]OKV90729.1 hypothetical protein AWP67_09595 [Escherichia coli]OKX70638.1 hypothetical protein AWP95_09380 [Escherichia coli]
MMTNAKLPDALCLSDLHEPCNILNFCAFVGRIRRLRHIQDEQSARCQQSGGQKHLCPFSCLPYCVLHITTFSFVAA